MNSLNPNSLKYRFTKGFLKALARINKHQPRSSSSSSSIEIKRRYRRIKTAAYASMACAVGTRRAWSRKLLWKIRPQTRNGRVLRRIGTTTTSAHYPMKKRSQKKPVEAGLGRVDELRKVVPGGEGMDTWSLLEETAHYMKCLITQVKVMRTIVAIYSTT